MSDIVSPKDRSRMMAGIRGKDTQPELAVRKALHALGFRYRIHEKRLPGKPDMVFRRYKAVIEINGCFWHRHGCHLFKWPSTRKEFWQKKISGNRERDIRNHEALKNNGWRILTIWECALKGRTRRPLEDVVKKVAKWLVSGKSDMEIEGIKKLTKADIE
jgi:DNA mismatch endonuclease (patch repair protein)